MDVYLHDVDVQNVPSTPNSTFPDLTNIRVFGADVGGHPMYVEIRGFRPWLYVAGDSLVELRAKISTEFWYRNVTKCEIVKRKRLMGFSDNQYFEYMFLEFAGMVPMHCGRKALRILPGLELFEDRVEPVLKFFHKFGVRPSSFFKMHNFSCVPGEGKSYYQKEFNVHCADIDPLIHDDRPPPPMLMCAYDIESSGLDPSTDSVFQVSMCFTRIGDPLDPEHASVSCKDGVVICVGETRSIDGTPILKVNNEKELLEKFKDMVALKYMSS